MLFHCYFKEKNDTILLPLWEEELKIGDKILLACDSHAKNDIKYICQNIYEFYYALTGKEKTNNFKRIFRKILIGTMCTWR